jgi:hypothetical protein
MLKHLKGGHIKKENKILPWIDFAHGEIFYFYFYDFFLIIIFLFFNHFPYPIFPAAQPFDFSLLFQFGQVLFGIA